MYQTWSVFSRHSPSTSTPVNDDPVRDAADPSPVADDDDVLFVKEVSAPAAPDDAPPAPRAFAADAAGSSPLSVAPLSELAAVAPATDAKHVTLRDVLRSPETKVDLGGIAAFEKSTEFRKNSKESHLLFLNFAAVFLGGQLKFAGADEKAIFADALYANALDINIAVIQSDGTLVKYLCKRSGASWVVLARNVYSGSENDSEDWGAVLARGDWTAVWFPSHVWFEANLVPHRALSGAEKAACEAVSEAASKCARDKARALEMLSPAEFEEKRLEQKAFYAAAEHPTSASQGYCTNLPQSLDGLMLPMMERSKGPGGGTKYLLAESGVFKNAKQCYVAVVLLNGNLVTLTFKTQGSAKAILLPLIKRGARPLTRTDNENVADIKNSHMMFMLTSAGDKLRLGTLKRQRETYDPAFELAKAQKQGKYAKRKERDAERKRADPGSVDAILRQDNLASQATCADRARRLRDEMCNAALNELVVANNSDLTKYVPKLKDEREARRRSAFGKLNMKLMKLNEKLIDRSTRFETWKFVNTQRIAKQKETISFEEMCTSDKIAEMYIAASKFKFGSDGALHEATSRVTDLGRLGVGSPLIKHAILVKIVDLDSVEAIGGGQKNPPSVERFLQAKAREIIQKETPNVAPESRLLFGEVYQTCVAHGKYSQPEIERYERLGVKGKARKPLRILEHGASFGGTVMAVLFPTGFAGCQCPNSKIKAKGVPNLGIDFHPDGAKPRVAHSR